MARSFYGTEERIPREKVSGGSGSARKRHRGVYQLVGRLMVARSMPAGAMGQLTSGMYGSLGVQGLLTTPDFSKPSGIQPAPVLSPVSSRSLIAVI